MLDFRDRFVELFVRFTMSCIEPIITRHPEVFFRYMLDQQGNEVQYGNGFFNIGIVFMFIVMESHVPTIIGINAGGCNNRAAGVTAGVFYDSAGVAEVWFGIDMESIFVLPVNGSFRFFKRRASARFRFIQEGSLESLAQTGVVKVSDNSPETIIGEPALREKTMDMWIPFEGSARGMQDTDETGDKVFAFIHFMEHSENDAAYSLKKTVRQGTVIQKERAGLLVDGKNKVPVGTVNEFKGHFCRAVNAVFVTAGRAKPRMAAERDEFEFAAAGTAIHSATIRRVSTINHLLNVFHNNGAGMEDIFNFFAVFSKNLLQDVHKSIMKEFWAKSNPTPQD